MPCGSRRRPSYPAFAPPAPPPLGLAQCVLSTGTVLLSVPHPLSAASQPCRCVLGGRGGRCPTLPTFIPHPWGGGGVWGGGLVVFPSLHACRRHDASTGQARGAAPVPLHGGGGMPCGSRRHPFYPAFAPPLVPPLGLARRVLSTGTVVWSVPHPLDAASPPCRFVLGGGARFAPPTCIPRGCVGGGGRPCRLPFVARTSQARRKHGAGRRCGTCPSAGGGGGACHLSPVVAPPTLRAPPRGGGGVWGGGGALVVVPSLHACRRHDASTTQARAEALGCCGGGGFAFGPSRPSPWYRLCTPGSPAADAPLW